MVKLISIIKRRNGLTRDEFFQHWKEIHAPLAASIVPGLRKYVQNHAIRVPGFESEIDGVAELWFDDLEALRNFRSLRESGAAKLKPLIDDENKFIDTSKRIHFFAEEHIIK